MERWLRVLLACALVLALAAPVAAAPEISVLVGGVKIQFDVPPVNMDGRVLVPLRAIGEALGFQVGFDPATKTVSLVKPGTEIFLVLGSREARVNGQVKTLDVPALAIEGRTMVPVRFVAENLGATVGWDGATQTVSITPKAAAPAVDVAALLARMKDAEQANPDLKMSGVMDMDMKMAFSGMEMSMRVGITMDIHQVGQNMLVSMSMSAPEGLGVPGTTFGTAIRDGAMYAQGPDGSWAFVQEVAPGTDLSELGIQDYTELKQLVDQFQAQAKTRVVGTERVDGVDTVVVEMTVPGAALNDFATELMGVMGLAEALQADADMQISFGDLYLKLWVNPENGFTHRVIETLQLTMTGSDPETGTVDMTVNVSAEFRITPTQEPIEWPELPPTP